MNFEEKEDHLILVLTSEANRTTADALAKEILNQRLAACVSLREIKSHFWWDDKLQEDNEVQLLIKTTKSQLHNLLETINKLHTYQTPELLYWSASASQPYLQWAEKSVCSNSK